MPRLTKDERDALEQSRQRELAAEAEKFKTEEAPKRLISLIGRAAQLGITTRIHLNEFDNTSVSKVVFKRDEQPFMDDTLTLDSPQWEYEYMDRRFNEIIEERDRELNRSKAASALWNGLSKEQQDLLKEYYLQPSGSYDR